MHAVVVKVSISDPDSATTELTEKVVPGVAQQPGFVAGYWTRKDNSGLSMVIFESEDAAQAASEMVRERVPQGVTVEDVELREVVANA